MHKGTQVLFGAAPRRQEGKGLDRQAGQIQGEGPTMLGEGKKKLGAKWNPVAPR